jgi:hypothetical protein
MGQMPTTTSSLDNPFQYSGDSIDEYKKKAELSPWVPVPDSVARKIFDRAIPEEDDSSDKSKEGEVSAMCVLSVACLVFLLVPGVNPYSYNERMSKSSFCGMIEMYFLSTQQDLCLKP